MFLDQVVPQEAKVIPDQLDLKEEEVKLDLLDREVSKETMDPLDVKDHKESQVNQELKDQWVLEDRKETQELRESVVSQEGVLLVPLEWTETQVYQEHQEPKEIGVLLDPLDHQEKLLTKKETLFCEETVVLMAHQDPQEEMDLQDLWVQGDQRETNVPLVHQDHQEKKASQE